MLNYRNILRVGSDPEKSMRTMELELRSSHHTIRKALDATEKAGISWPLSEDCTNEMLMELLFPEEYQKSVLYKIPDYSYIHTEPAKAGTNLTILWEEYFASVTQRDPYRIYTHISMRSIAVGLAHQKLPCVSNTNREILWRWTGLVLPWIFMTRVLAKYPKRIYLLRFCHTTVSPMRKPAMI